VADVRAGSGTDTGVELHRLVVETCALFSAFPANQRRSAAASAKVRLIHSFPTSAYLCVLCGETNLEES
ncbi:MAG TPA: hypothetical protein VFW23_16975, partial [Tepidisphaeraceae bacterium]|nr:hypothetical protein [Tepidisphaeraceae bacterium]